MAMVKRKVMNNKNPVIVDWDDDDIFPAPISPFLVRREPR